MLPFLIIISDIYLLGMMHLSRQPILNLIFNFNKILKRRLLP